MLANKHIRAESALDTSLGVYEANCPGAKTCRVSARQQIFGAAKNDCERNAAKRLLRGLRARYPGLKMILVEDALYANAPRVRQINESNWHYILHVKPDSHASLARQFVCRRATSQVQEWQFTDA